MSMKQVFLRQVRDTKIQRKIKLECFKQCNWSSPYWSARVASTHVCQIINLVHLAEKLVNSPPPPPPKPQKLPPPLDMGPGGHHARMMNHPKIHASLDYSVLPGYILQKPPKFTIFWGFLLKSGILCIIPTNAFGFLLYLSC